MIGIIFSSMLDYKEFLSLNGLKSTDWVPCDGRSANNSSYGKLKDNVPDLRGVFLRGNNDMGDSGNAGTLNNDQLDPAPDKRDTNGFQNDSFKTHNHTANMKLGAEPLTGGARATAAAGAHGSVSDTWVSEILVNTSGLEAETRPKNYAVYYYIQIN